MKTNFAHPIDTITSTEIKKNLKLEWFYNRI